MSHYSQIPSLINIFLDKLLDARGQLGMVNRALYWAPERARLIAYKVRFRVHLEYVSAAWDPTCKKGIADLEKKNR